MQFENYTEIPYDIQESLLHYYLILQIHNHKFNIPLTFENCANVVMTALDDTLFTFSEVNNDTRIVNFGVDKHFYEITDFSTKSTIDLTHEMAINADSLTFSCKTNQDIMVSFELIHPNLCRDIITAICDVYRQHSVYFSRD